MPWIGDRYIPHIADDTRVGSAPVSQEDYINRGRLVHQFQADLETGSMSYFQTVDGHTDEESLREQIYAAESLVQKSRAQNAIEFLDRKGYLSVNNVERPRGARDNLREGTIEFTYQPDVDYVSGLKIRNRTVPNDYDLDSDGVVVIGSSAEDVREVDSSVNTTELAETATLQTDRGDIDYYETSEPNVAYDRGETFVEPDREGSVRVYDHKGSTTEDDWERIHSPRQSPDHNYVLDNGVLRFIFNHPDDEKLHLHFYEDDTWKSAGTLNYEAERYHLKEINSYKSEVGIPGGSIELRKGYTTAKFNVTDENADRIELDTSDGDNSFQGASVQDFYMYAYHSNIDADYFMIKPESDGDLDYDQDENTMWMTGLSPDERRNFYVGVYISGIAENRQEMAEWMMTEPTYSQTLLQRSAL